MLARALDLFRPPAHTNAPAEDPIALRGRYRRWRRLQLQHAFVGYAVFYLVRKNIPIALPLLQRDLGIGKAALGSYLTLHDLMYGVSKFGNGLIGDRANPRYFMALGLAASAAMNLAFGLSSGLYT